MDKVSSLVKSNSPIYNLRHLVLISNSPTLGGTTRPQTLLTPNVTGTSGVRPRMHVIISTNELKQDHNLGTVSHTNRRTQMHKPKTPPTQTNMKNIGMSKKVEWRRIISTPEHTSKPNNQCDQINRLVWFYSRSRNVTMVVKWHEMTATSKWVLFQPSYSIAVPVLAAHS